MKRSGLWTVPAENSFRTWFGHIKLDLREAQITAPETHLHARALFGNVDLLVPESVEVDVQARTEVGRTNLRASSGIPGAPRIVDADSAVVHTSFKPDGYVSHALEKGDRLGFQASSDHVSTHVSYACILAEEFNELTAGFADHRAFLSYRACPLAAQCVHAAARTADVAEQQLQHGGRANNLGPV